MCIRDRDDIGGFLPKYLDLKLLAGDPFVSIDQSGVGELIKIGVERLSLIHI